jgi:hypothetical protein
MSTIRSKAKRAKESPKKNRHPETRISKSYIEGNKRSGSTNGFCQWQHIHTDPRGPRVSSGEGSEDDHCIVVAECTASGQLDARIKIGSKIANPSGMTLTTSAELGTHVHIRVGRGHAGW